MSNPTIIAIRDKLRQLDVLSGFYGARQLNDLDALCADLAFNDVAGLLAVAEAAQLLIDAPKCQRVVQSFGHEKCTPAGAACEGHQWHVLKHSLTMLTSENP
jgi:hypothetical protein